VEGKVTLNGLTDNQSGVWELRLPTTSGRVLIEGLNHKFAAGQKPLRIWAPSRQNYFDLNDLHWLLDPRRQAQRAPPAQKGKRDFSVYNNSDRPLSVDLKSTRLNFSHVNR